MKYEGEIKLSIFNSKKSESYDLNFGIDEITTQDSIWGIETAKSKKFLNLNNIKESSWFNDEEFDTDDGKYNLANINFMLQRSG